MDILSRVAKGMQGVLTEAADIIGRKTCFIKRLRKLIGISTFPKTSKTFRKLAYSHLHRMDRGMGQICFLL
jgi:hypothetical protein